MRKTLLAFSQVLILSTVVQLSGCGSTSDTIVDNIPESENLFFTEDGRLFVSGGSNVFEIIKKTDGSYEKLDMFHEECLVEGIAERQGYLYAVCSKTNLSEFLDSYFLAAKISNSAPTEADITEDGAHPTMNLTVIADMVDVGVPNGIVADEFGNIFVSDSGKGDIVKITLSDDAVVDAIEVWAPNVAFFVNGLKWIGDDLYFTGIKTGSLMALFGSLKRNPDGSPGEVTELFKRFGTVLDDFTPYGDGFVMTDYLKGTLIFWEDGVVTMETEPDTFFAPTAVVPAQAPMFSEDALVVTEKGIIFNGNPNYGNKVGLYYPPL